MNRARKLGAVVVALAVAVGVAGCGVPADTHPRRLSAGGVPFGLLNPTTSTTVEVATADDSNQVTVEVYELGLSGRLVPVQRSVAPPVTVVNVLQKLFAGPSVGELAAGFQSYISTQTKLLGAQVVDGVANIDVSREFTEVSGNEQIFALAQIVFTATSVSDVQSVAFLLGGDPKEVPTQDGTLTTRPLTRNDYARLVESH